MKLLTEEQRKQIDSSDATLEKWREFLPGAVKNLAYRKDVYENLFPYDKADLPRIDVTKDVPKINKDSGRIIFKRTLADKLNLWFNIAMAKQYHQRVSYDNRVYALALGLKLIGKLFKNKLEKIANGDADTVSEGFSTTDLLEYKDSIENMRSAIAATEGRKEELEALVSDINIVKGTNASCGSSGFSLVTLPSDYFEEYETVADKYLTTRVIITMLVALTHLSYTSTTLSASTVGVGSSTARQIIDFLLHMLCDPNTIWDLPERAIQMIFENYFVLSQNPSDIFMASTKQAFASCLSTMSNSTSSGIQNGPGYGLPALMANEAVWISYFTAGLHKNFYFDVEQWNLPGEERDHSKAYKYIKTTSRSFVYVGIPRFSTQKEDNRAELFLGRVFNAWDSYSEPIRLYYNSCLAVALAEHNILTSTYKMLEALKKENVRFHVLPITENVLASGVYLTNCPDIKYLEEHQSSTGVTIARKRRNEDIEKTIPENNYQLLKTLISAEQLRETDTPNIATRYKQIQSEGILCNPAIVGLDRFKQINSIYFDDISLCVNKLNPRRSITYVLDNSKTVDGWNCTQPPLITLDHLEVSGSCNVSTSQHTTGADMYKIMTGKKSMSNLCISAAICPVCGEIYNKNSMINAWKIVDGKIKVVEMCPSCAELENLTRCEACGDYYEEELAALHTHEIPSGCFTNRESMNGAGWLWDVLQILRNLRPGRIGAPSVRSRRLGGSCLAQMLRGTLTEDNSGTYNYYLSYDILHEILEYNPAYRNYSIVTLGTTKIKLEDVVPELPEILKDLELQIDIGVNRNNLSKIRICSKCHRIILPEDDDEAMLLLPNKRLICKNCIDKIRMKKANKEVYKQLLTQAGNWLSSLVDTTEIPEDELSRALQVRGIEDNFHQWEDALFKKPYKQLMSLIASGRTKLQNFLGLGSLEKKNLEEDKDEIITALSMLVQVAQEQEQERGEEQNAD